MEPIVSICCLTYNHAPYIRQCLDGFVMQKVSFPIEILIHDDASTDGTQDIIREYEARYPDIIKPIYQKENQYSKGIRVSLVYNYSRVKGKYIALCEGDDYWTDPYKLQKQVDFLESHPDYVMCSHRFDRYWQEKGILEEDPDKDFKGADYGVMDLMCGKWYVQTLTVMFRRTALDVSLYESYNMALDLILFFSLLKKGRGYCLCDVMAVYRIHAGGIWSETSLNKQRKMEFRAKTSIYNVEKSYDAAVYLLYMFTKTISRFWMMGEICLFLNIIKIFTQHFGLGFAIRLFANKLCFNKRLKRDYVLSLMK